MDQAERALENGVNNYKSRTVNNSQIPQSRLNQITSKIPGAPGQEGWSRGGSKTSKEHLGIVYIHIKEVKP